LQQGAEIAAHHDDEDAGERDENAEDLSRRRMLALEPP